MSKLLLKERYDTGERKLVVFKKWKHQRFPTKKFRTRIWICKVNDRDGAEQRQQIKSRL